MSDGAYILKGTSVNKFVLVFKNFLLPKHFCRAGLDRKNKNEFSQPRVINLYNLNCFRKAESDSKHKDRLGKIKNNYIPVSQLKGDELKLRRAKENAKKEKQRQCKKKVRVAKKDEKLEGGNKSNYENTQISDYEKLRQENIQERNHKMKTLGLKNHFG